MPRSMASADISFMSPPPRPSRTTSFSLVRVSKRSPPTGRATTRWKLFVPMSSAAEHVPPVGGARLERRHGALSLRSGRCRRRCPPRTPSRKLAIFSNPLPRTFSVEEGSPTTRAVWIASSRSPGSTAVPRDVCPLASGMMSPTQAPVRQSPTRAALLAVPAGCRATAAPPRSTPRRGCSRRRSRRSGRTAVVPAARRRTPVASRRSRRRPSRRRQPGRRRSPRRPTRRARP